MIFLLAAITALQQVHAASFIHPGVFLGSQQLSYAKSSALAGKSPFSDALAKAKASPLGSLTYAPQGPPKSRVIECGSYSKPNLGCSAEDEDGAAAYLQLVLFNMTRDARHASVATSILRSYATGLDRYNNSNAPLQAAWGLSKWTRAAELAAHLPGTGWTADDASAFARMLERASLPLVSHGSPSNGNWELAMIEGLMGYSVLTENATLFATATNFWRQRVPAYFFNYAADGSKPRPAPRGKPSWYDQTVFSAATSGVAQETCRDEGHTTYSVASASNAAETALLQGVDLWGEQAERLATAFEFNARLLLPGTPSPSDLCSGRAVDARAEYPSYEVALAALGGRRGMALPNVLKHIQTSVRTNPNPVDPHMIIYETLTHGGVPPQAGAVGGTSGSILARELMHLAVGLTSQGPSPTSVALTSSPTSPQALVAQALNAPMGVRGFDTSAAPLWSFFPPGTDSSALFQVSSCTNCTIAPGEMDTVIFQWEEGAASQSNCTFWGVSSSSSPGFVWSVVLPSCTATAGSPAINPKFTALSPDGSTIAAQLVLGGTCFLLALEGPTGKERWRVPCQGVGGGLGMAFSANGQWVLSASGGTAFVYAAGTGVQRGTMGCPVGWNTTLPALSSAGDYIVSPTRNAVWVCTWSSGVYSNPISVPLDAWGQDAWVPSSTAMLESGGRVMAGSIFAGGDLLNFGRMFALDVGAAVAGGGGATPCAVVDALLNDFGKEGKNAALPSYGWGQGTIVPVVGGGYWFVGMLGGDNGGTLPTEFLFVPAGTGSPWGTPVWFWDGMGSVTSIDARIVESDEDGDTMHVLAGGPLGNGGIGGGGHVYWHEISNSKH